MNKNPKKLYFCAMENTISNNIHASQVYPVIKRTLNMNGLFLNPWLEVSKSRIGPIYFDNRHESNVKIWRLPIATYFFFSPWYIFPIIYMILTIYLFLHCLFNRYDIIHCRHTLSGCIAIPIAKIFRIKVLSDIRGCYTDEGVLLGRWRSGSLSFRFYKKLEKFVYRYSDTVSGISPVMCRYIASMSPLTKAVYIPAVVDTKRIFFDEKLRCQARNAIGLSSDDKCFIYVGSIGAWHSIDALLSQLRSTVTKIGAEDKNIHLVVLSKDSRFIEALKELPYRVIARSVQPSEVNYYLNAADYGLLPGKKIISESDKNVFGVMISSKAQEYLSCGLKVISNEGIEYFQSKNKFNTSETRRSEISKTFQNEFSLDNVLLGYSAVYEELT
ncbi:hypothetical protein N9I16_05355 [Porticoccaceae bacterium]|nr:hypothetical protein [Porticoccaceae bacterium]